METQRYMKTMKGVKIGILVLTALHFVIGAPPDQTDLHKVMTRNERIKYLDARSHEDVPEYEIVSFVLNGKKRNTGEDHNRVKFAAFQKNFDINLKPSSDFISPSLVLDKRQRDGGFTREVYKTKGQFYHGELASDARSVVTVREKENNGKLSGTIVNDDHIYKIEPLPSHLTKHVTLQGSAPHIISRRSLHKDRKKRSQPVKVPLLEEIFQDVRAKRSDQEPMRRKWIEVMILADNSTVSYYGNETMDYVLSIANLVNRLYQDPKLGVNVTFALVKVVLIDGYEPELDFNKNNIQSAYDYLGKFQQWAEKRNPPVENPQHWDNAVLLSRKLCGLKNCYLDGLAYFGVPCNHALGVSVNDAHGLGSAFSVAHELAHNLNVDHDSSKCSGGSIMAAVAPKGVGAFRWSNCSRKVLEETMRTTKCHDDRPSSSLKVPRNPAGARWKGDRQCQMKYGPDPALKECWMTVGMCHDALLCTRGGNCFGRGHPPADGTKCGFGKWCIRGKCVSDGTTRPPPIDGNWGSWQSFSPCSRTCGGGIRHRTRKCNNPTPQHGGKSCPGQSTGHYEMCNQKVCSKGNYRLEQCESFNTNTIKYSDYFNPGNPCTRTCKVKNVVYFKGSFNDGTPCSLESSADVRCANRKCQVFNCDGKLRRLGTNEAVRDRCKVCNGKGDRCRRVTGRYTRDWRYWGPAKATVMLRIPAGATNVKIVEDAMSNNILSLKTDPPEKSNFLIGVPSTSTVIHVAGTLVKYYQMNIPKERLLYRENITISGPTTRVLNVMYIWIGPEGNPGFTYSYYTPLSSDNVVPSPTSAFKWRYSAAKHCSTSCARGVRQRIVTCHRVDDVTKVSTKHCDSRTRPSETEPCNTQPCPPYWQIGSWGRCSQTCAGGRQSRDVKCVRQVSQMGAVEVVRDSLCPADSKPTGSKKCNDVDCPPEWETGAWSQCSAVCGGGIQRRSVKCKQRLGNGALVEEPIGKCRHSIGAAVSAKRACNTQDCLHRWVVEYMCDECKAGYKHVGCYQDSYNRAIPKLVGFYGSAELVQRCSEVAKSDGYDTFGAEYSSECWSGPRANETYDKYGPSTRCSNGVGGSWANDVYFLVVDAVSIVQCQHKVTKRTVSATHCRDERLERPVVPEKQPCDDVCR